MCTCITKRAKISNCNNKMCTCITKYEQLHNKKNGLKMINNTKSL